MEGIRVYWRPISAGTHRKPELLPGAEEMAEIAAEFSYPGVAEAVPRYFHEIPKSKAVDLAKFSMPILYIHGEHDPRQPVEYCVGMEQHLPGLQAILVLDSGHFITRERPTETANALMWFFNSMLGSGLPIFHRSKAYGLPTKPVAPPANNFGVNHGVNAVRTTECPPSNCKL